ncbi:NAD-dependent epimerase/dehydratase family protein, partial [Parasphingorhabdus sp.]
MTMATDATNIPPILVTGAAGFIGHAVSGALIARGDMVIGIDNLNDYYDPDLKQARLNNLEQLAGFRFEKTDISDEKAVRALVEDNGVRKIIHLAAQAGVRYSLENPFAYQKSNLQGHLALLEASRHAPDFEHLVYASSSSVYGDKPMG